MNVLPEATNNWPFVRSWKLILFAVREAGAFEVMLMSGPVFAALTLAPYKLVTSGVAPAELRKVPLIAPSMVSVPQFAPDCALI